MMKKKGQGLSLNVIIVAAIALIVLIVLWAIFTGRMGGFSKGVVGTQKCKPACEAAGYSDGNAQAGDCTDPSKDIGKMADATGTLQDHCCCS